MRLTSLDVFRGVAIASMILVNNPGSWDYVYPPLDHAEWNGCTPTDLVFPFFLFAVGAAMSFSLSKYTEGNQPKSTIYWRIVRRAALLFLLGLLLNTSSIFLDVLLNGSPIENFSKIRILGVLQRISLAYFLAAIAILNLRERNLRILTATLLLGYWGALTLIPVPGYGQGLLTPEGNLGAYLDRLILGTQHLYRQGQFDPESLLGTLPAIATVLMGYFTTQWLQIQPIKTRTSLSLAIFGLCCLVIGQLWGFLFPINKQLWTSSYVLFTAGWALLLLAVCYETIEVRRWQWGRPFEVMGLNAIFVFVASGLVARILLKTHIGSGEKPPTTYTWIYENWFRPWGGAMNGSLAFALITVCFWWLILYLMYRRGWFFKI
ncbi:MAG TPA: DUF5009 domain-containing protein [Kamptonema sp.]|nr:DUF5009 domain-containing protein [Kamptonema sp.]